VVRIRLVAAASAEAGFREGVAAWTVPMLTL
jgi:hypothetical protein